MIAVGADPSSIRSGGKSALDYIAAMQDSDGHYRYSSSSDQTPVWVTGEVLVAATGSFFPVAGPAAGAGAGDADHDHRPGDADHRAGGADLPGPDPGGRIRLRLALDRRRRRPAPPCRPEAPAAAAAAPARWSRQPRAPPRAAGRAPEPEDRPAA